MHMCMHAYAYICIYAYIYESTCISLCLNVMYVTNYALALQRSGNINLSQRILSQPSRYDMCLSYGQF